MQTTRTIAAWTKSGRQDGVGVGKSHFTVFLFGKPCCRLEEDGYVSFVARHCRRTSPFMLLASFLTLLLHYSTPPIVLESLSRKRGINSKWKLSSLQLYSAHGGAHSDAGGDGWWRGRIRWWVKTRAGFYSITLLFNTQSLVWQFNLSHLIAPPLPAIRPVSAVKTPDGIRNQLVMCLFSGNSTSVNVFKYRSLFVL